LHWVRFSNGPNMLLGGLFQKFISLILDIHSTL
jgi:hypothetical protein